MFSKQTSRRLHSQSINFNDRNFYHLNNILNHKIRVNAITHFLSTPMPYVCPINRTKGRRGTKLSPNLFETANFKKS